MFDYILLKLPTNQQLRIIQALDNLVSNPTNIDLKKLKDRPESRLRAAILIPDS